MDFLRFLFYAFLIYIAWKLVFNLIIPVYRTTRQIKKGFREMQDQMQQHARQYDRQPEPQKVTTPKNGGGDYIEFEEIK